jgi:polysaccharide biosynthesis/export protein ExoF
MSAPTLGRVLSAIAATLLLSAPAIGQTTAYLLGPQDQLRIRVYDWRSAPTDAHEWTALTGVFIVSASGEVSLPMLGEVRAANETTSTLARVLAERLQAKIGLAQRPDASVEVVVYRPFYIVGAVEKPGEYAFRPGMTLLQAVSIAGGLMRVTEPNLLGYEHDSIVERGDLRVGVAARNALLIRLARLEALAAGADQMKLPDEIATKLSDPTIDIAVRQQNQLFAQARDAFAAQAQTLSGTRALLEREVETLASKDASLVHQIELAKKELEDVTSLVNKGLAVAPRRLQVEQNTAQLESARLDVQLGSLRSQQEIGRLDQTLVELKSRLRTDALTEASADRDKLTAVEQQISTADKLIYQTEVRAPEFTANAAQQSARVLFSITRPSAQNQGTNIAAEESTLLEPGDTVRIEYAKQTSVADRKVLSD